MKYVTQLTDEELTDLYKLFLGEDDEFVDLTITRDNNSIALEDILEFQMIKMMLLME